MYRMNKIAVNKNKLSVFYIVSVLLLSCFFPAISGASRNTDVSDRELLMLAIMSYKNNQKANTWENTGDEKFDARWFGGYGDASELTGWHMVDCVINPSIKSMKGFSAVTYQKADTIVVAFRGTDSGVVTENWEYAVPKREHPQIKFLNLYIDHLKDQPFMTDSSKIYIVGHSLGGYLATYCLGRMLQIEELKHKIVKVLTFNGLGLGYIKDKSIKETLFKVSPDIIVNYSVNGDVVSLIGQHFTKTVYLKSLKSKSPATSVLVSSNPHFPHNFLGQEPFALV